MPERVGMSARERRLREDNIAAASMLRAATAVGSRSDHLHGGGKSTQYVEIALDTVNRVLAALEGWEYQSEGGRDTT
jgi:hypothetical protein